MSVEWSLLVEVREMRERLALEAMVADQRIADERRKQALAAQVRLRQQEEASVQHWLSTRRSMAKGRTSVAQLQQAAAWSRALDAEIAQKSAVAQRSERVAAEHQQVAEASRERLAQAAGGVVKAETMHERERAKAQRLEEARHDATTDDVAATAWAARRAS